MQQRSVARQQLPTAAASTDWPPPRRLREGRLACKRCLVMCGCRFCSNRVNALGERPSSRVRNAGQRWQQPEAWGAGWSCSRRRHAPWVSLGGGSHAHIFRLAYVESRQGSKRGEGATRQAAWHRCRCDRLQLPHTLTCCHEASKLGCPEPIQHVTVTYLAGRVVHALRANPIVRPACTPVDQAANAASK